MTHRRNKPVIGLAGGIGAGKTAVAKILADFGCVVSFADDIAREALHKSDVKTELVQWWGEDILDANGEINRRRVADIVFRDASERVRLESLIHPIVGDRRREQFSHAPPDAPALVIDAPLVFEAGLEAECDAVIFVETDRATRLARLKDSRGWSAQEVESREASQLPLDEKRKRADYVIQNTGDLDDLKKQVRVILEKIIESVQT